MTHETAGAVDDISGWLAGQLGSAAEGALSDPAFQAQVERTALAVLNSEATRQAARRYFIEASLIMAAGLFASLAAYRLFIK